MIFLIFLPRKFCTTISCQFSQIHHHGTSSPHHSYDHKFFSTVLLSGLTDDELTVVKQVLDMGEEVSHYVTFVILLVFYLQYARCVHVHLYVLPVCTCMYMNVHTSVQFFVLKLQCTCSTGIYYVYIYMCKCTNNIIYLQCI